MIDPVLYTIKTCLKFGSPCVALKEFSDGDESLETVEAALEEIDELRSLPADETLLDRPSVRELVDDAYDLLADAERECHRDLEERDGEERHGRKLQLEEESDY